MITLCLVLPPPPPPDLGVNCSPTPIAASCPAITNFCLISKALPLSKYHKNGTTKHVEFSGGFLSSDNVFEISHIVAHTNNMHLFTAEMYSSQRYTEFPPIRFTCWKMFGLCLDSDICQHLHRDISLPWVIGERLLDELIRVCLGL